MNVGAILLISLPNTMWISNLMLANNICDLAEDEKNNRYTLVHYLGKRHSLQLFVIMNSVAILALVAAVVLKIAPWTMLLTLVVLPVIVKQVKLFLSKQVKKETFSCAIKILAIGAVSQTLTFLIYMPFINN